jgi:hypothetical protein
MEEFKIKALELKDKMYGFTEYQQICNALTVVKYVQENYSGEKDQIELWNNIKKYLIELIEE